jgi:hypothetical protein
MEEKMEKACSKKKEEDGEGEREQCTGAREYGAVLVFLLPSSQRVDRAPAPAQRIQTAFFSVPRLSLVISYQIFDEY